MLEEEGHNLWSTARPFLGNRAGWARRPSAQITFCVYSRPSNVNVWLENFSFTINVCKISSKIQTTSWRMLRAALTGPVFTLTELRALSNWNTFTCQEAVYSSSFDRLFMWKGCDVTPALLSGFWRYLLFYSIQHFAPSLFWVTTTSQPFFVSVFQTALEELVATLQDDITV